MIKDKKEGITLLEAILENFENANIIRKGHKELLNILNTRYSKVRLLAEKSQVNKDMIEGVAIKRTINMIMAIVSTVCVAVEKDHYEQEKNSIKILQAIINGLDETIKLLKKNSSAH